jgi:hypothetical protein
MADQTAALHQPAGQLAIVRLSTHRGCTTPAFTSIRSRSEIKSGSLLDLIRRQLRFASRGGHIVHRWKGAVGSTAG